MEITKLSIYDAPKIAEIHLNSFKGFFLTSLGKKFLIKFYSSIIKSSQGVVIGLIYEKELIGFAVGAKIKKGFYKSIFINNFFSLLFSCFSNLIRKPSKIIKLIQSLLTEKNFNIDYSNSGTLLSICVSPTVSNKGFGKILLKEFEKEIFKYNNVITLTTDNINNQYVNNFYINNGYILDAEFFQGNRKMNLYIKKNNYQ